MNRERATDHVRPIEIANMTLLVIGRIASKATNRKRRSKSMADANWVTISSKKKIKKMIFRKEVESFEHKSAIFIYVAYHSRWHISLDPDNKRPIDRRCGRP